MKASPDPNNTEAKYNSKHLQREYSDQAELPELPDPYFDSLDEDEKPKNMIQITLDDLDKALPEEVDAFHLSTQSLFSRENTSGVIRLLEQHPSIRVIRILESHYFTFYHGSLSLIREYIYENNRDIQITVGGERKKRNLESRRGKQRFIRKNLPHFERMLQDECKLELYRGMLESGFFDAVVAQLYYEERYSFNEIALIMGFPEISIGKIQGRMRRFNAWLGLGNSAKQEERVRHFLKDYYSHIMEYTEPIRIQEMKEAYNVDGELPPDFLREKFWKDWYRIKILIKDHLDELIGRFARNTEKPKEILRMLKMFYGVDQMEKDRYTIREIGSITSHHFSRVQGLKKVGMTHVNELFESRYGDVDG